MRACTLMRLRHVYVCGGRGGRGRTPYRNRVVIRRGNDPLAVEQDLEHTVVVNAGEGLDVVTSLDVPHPNGSDGRSLTFGFMI